LTVGYRDIVRPLRWAQETNIWAHGYWFFDWADYFVPIKQVDYDNKTIVAHTFGGYGDNKAKIGQTYFMVPSIETTINSVKANLLSEIDIPGEYYVDNITNMLYFYPPHPLTASSAILVSMITNLINQQASYVTFENMVLEVARGSIIVGRYAHCIIAFLTHLPSGGTGNVFKNLEIRNAGAKAIYITNAKYHTIDSCYIHATGEGGVQLTGGDRVTLTTSGTS
jgi:hypothetical protein